MKIPKKARSLTLSGINTSFDFMHWISLCTEAISNNGNLPLDHPCTSPFSEMGPASFGDVAIAAVEQGIKQAWLPERKREQFRMWAFNINVSAQIETAKILSRQGLLLDLERALPEALNTPYWQELQRWWNDNYSNGKNHFENLRVEAIRALRSLLTELSKFKNRTGLGAGRPHGSVNNFHAYADLVILADLENQNLLVNGIIETGILRSAIQDYVSRGLLAPGTNYGDKPDDVVHQHYVRIKGKLDNPVK